MRSEPHDGDLVSVRTEGPDEAPRRRRLILDITDPAFLTPLREAPGATNAVSTQGRVTRVGGQLLERFLNAFCPPLIRPSQLDQRLTHLFRQNHE